MPVGDFAGPPTLDYNLVQTDKPKFLAQLRHALVYVGFLYLSNPPVAPALVSAVISWIPRLFALSQEEKDRIAISNTPHFLGYSRLGSELTKGATDLREQFDFASPHQNKWTPGAPEFLKLWGDAQWPSEESLPGFRKTMETYIAQVEDLSFEFAALFSEALGLPQNALDRFYDSPKKDMQHRCKVIKYPAVDGLGGGSNQGVGPHYDAGFFTFLLQASPHEGLQVQNFRGDWVPASPIPGTFVVNIGKAVTLPPPLTHVLAPTGLETVTRGAAIATSHRVISPTTGSGPRYSIPLFQNISQCIRVSEHLIDLPTKSQPWCEREVSQQLIVPVNFSEHDREQSGLVTLIGRVKSHPEVAQRHYPGLFEKYFPDGLPPAQGEVY